MNRRVVSTVLLLVAVVGFTAAVSAQEEAIEECGGDQDCLFRLAMDTRNETVCDALNSSRDREACPYMIAHLNAIKFEDVSYCEEIEPGFASARVSHLTEYADEYPGDASLYWEFMDENDLRRSCEMLYGFLTEDTEYCPWDACYWRLAFYAEDPKYCGEISPNRSTYETRERCYHEMAQELSNPDLCENAGEHKPDCLDALGVDTSTAVDEDADTGSSLWQRIIEAFQSLIPF